MKLLIPCLSEVHAADMRLMRLAEFIGISCEVLPLMAVQDTEYLGSASGQDSCLVVNPRVIKEWAGSSTFPPHLGSSLLSHFSHLLVHGLRPDRFDANLVSALSHGQLQAVHEIEEAGHRYDIALDSEDVCETFSGLSFGPVNPANDRVLSLGGDGSCMRNLISIDGHPFMAAVSRDRCEVFFLASEDTADLTSEVDGASPTSYFSRFVPHTMALRHIFGEECWRPCEHHASVIIDDPLLRQKYGFLNFDSLLQLMEQHNFHTTVAFIPHNFQRNSRRITGMFNQNTDRFAICFHGNDHTGAEFASTETALLSTMLDIAEHRMDVHRKKMGLACDRVMVFPQGKFSVEAMKVLKAHNFYAAVNTVPHPAEETIRLTIGELAQPAVLRYEAFPLFLRKTGRETRNPDIAFDLFFGRPVLIVEHHDIFQRPESLAELAARINVIAPGVRWSGLATAISGSVLRRRRLDATYVVRAYAGSVRISNEFNSAQNFVIQWSHLNHMDSAEQVLKDGLPCSSVEIDDAGLRVSMALAPRTSHSFSVVHRNVHSSFPSLGVRHHARAFVRRRLSELRDNYLSKSPGLLATAKNIQHRLLR